MYGSSILMTKEQRLLLRKVLCLKNSDFMFKENLFLNLRQKNRIKKKDSIFKHKTCTFMFEKRVAMDTVYMLTILHSKLVQLEKVT